MSLRSRLPIIDFEWSSDGDYVFRNGDIADTKSVTGKAFIQEIEDRVKSAFNDWKLLPNKGANIEEYYGEINNEKTWKGIESSISFSLTKDSFVDQRDFVVTVAPVSDHEAAVRIDFNASLTDVIPNSKIVIKVVYDLLGQGPYMVR